MSAVMHKSVPPVLQGCNAVCCSVLQCVAVCCNCCIVLPGVLAMSATMNQSVPRAL